MTECQRSAVFLDRDGVINVPVVREGKPYPPSGLEDFRIYPEVAPACRKLKEAGYLLVVATNQPDVGRGTMKKEVVEEVHQFMCRQLPIDYVEVCYDRGQGHPSAYHKPAPGMLLRAAKLFSIDLKTSFMVGDRWRDIDCGVAAGCLTVFVDRGYTEALKQQPNYRARDLLEAADIILTHPAQRSER